MRHSSPYLLASLLLFPSLAGAQVVRGQLLNGETGLPLEGAILVLQGQGGELATVLSNAAGRFLIRAPGAGSYTVRADRIGHASTTSDPFSLVVGDTLDLRLVAAVRAIQLEGLEVAGERRCEVRPESGRAVATVWEEARKALAAAALTEATGLYRYRTIRFVRELDTQGRRVLSERRRVTQGYQAAPFESLPAETLVSEGFMRTDPDGDLYFAPDAKALLSDPFLDTHCLGLVSGQGDTAGMLGVSFEPIDGRELPEIRGVVWVDPATAELRHVDFTYENLDPALRSEAVGGKVAFQGLPNGTWIVTEWRIRMPNAALAPDYRGGRQVVLAGIREVGGEVDRIQNQAGETVLEAQRATLTGVVLDETGVAPLSGATVGLVGVQASARTGADGSFSLPGLSEGVYSVSFSHPTIPALGGL
ncbi:MAG: carboxypeptidase regulatory-like domain-containing protein, partial [Longimicrobiales bacterium]